MPQDRRIIDMNRVFYFNINYKCNNNCVFCFSHHVGYDLSEIEAEELFDRLKKMQADDKDLVVINGGEPTLHRDFQKILDRLNEMRISFAVYTNGRRISNYNCISMQSRGIIVIPIHGNRDVHDAICRVSGAFDDTVQSLRYLNDQRIPYALKFIITCEMVDSGFDICSFLLKYKLQPNAIIFARVNETIKSKNNGYETITYDKMKSYVYAQRKKIGGALIIRYLDIPLCMVPEYLGEMDISVLEKVPKVLFFFNDKNHYMQQRDYYKERLQLQECNGCKYSTVCDLLGRSYYLIEEKNQRLVLKVE